MKYGVVKPRTDYLTKELKAGILERKCNTGKRNRECEETRKEAAKGGSKCRETKKTMIRNRLGQQIEANQ